MKRLSVLLVVIILAIASAATFILFSTETSPSLFTYRTDMANEGYFYYGSPAVDDEHVYLGTSVKWHYLADGGGSIPNSFQLICLDKTNGDVVWKHDLGKAELQNGPLLMGDMVIISVKYYNESNYHTNATIRAFSAADGTAIWEREVVSSIPTDYDVDGGPWDQQSMGAFLFQGMASDGNSTLLAGGDLIRSIDPANGSVIWETNLNNENINFIVLDGDSAYAFGRSNLYKVHVNNGSMMWQLTYQNGSVFHIGFQGVVLPDHSVLVGLSGQLSKISGDGEVLWSYHTGEQDIRAQPAVDSSGNIYVGTKANQYSYFFKLNSTGQQQWQWRLVRICILHPYWVMMEMSMWVLKIVTMYVVVSTFSIS